MTLIRWTPFRELSTLRDEMNRLFNSYFTASPDMEASYTWNPVVDISENDNEIRVVAEVPGMTKEDVNISLQDNVLTIKGEKKQEKEDKKETYHRIERAYGSFERSFSLPSSVQTEKVKASYKDGILTVVLPKSEEAKPKEIDISVN